MIMNQKVFKFILSMFFVTLLSPSTFANEITQPTLGEDGLYRHSWFLDSFLDLKEDMQAAQENGKRLVVLIEQKGCIYCKKVQTEILVDPKINAYIRKNFEIVQIDLWGDKEVTDLDGEVTTEKKLARKWRSMFTPTIAFMPETVELAKGKSGGDAAVAIMPGAFGKGTFLALFEWVKMKRYKTGEHFQKYVNDRYWQKKGGRPK
jgi:thioredoxin-related protein